MQTGCGGAKPGQVMYCPRWPVGLACSLATPHSTPRQASRELASGTTSPVQHSARGTRAPPQQGASHAALTFACARLTFIHPKLTQSPPAPPCLLPQVASWKL